MARLCWDNINNFKFTRNGTLLSNDGKTSYLIKEHCKKCGHAYVTTAARNSVFCSNSCTLENHRDVI